MQNKRKIKQKKGFTLVELITIIILLAILVLIITPITFKTIENVRFHAFKTSVHSILKAGEIYKTEHHNINNEDISIFDNDVKFTHKQNFNSGKLIFENNQVIADKIGNDSYCASGNINDLIIIKDKCENIEISPPLLVDLSVNMITSSSISIAVAAEDKNGIKGYQFSKDNGTTWTPLTTNSTYSFKKLKKNTPYKIKVKVINNIDLESEFEPKTITTNKIDQPTYTVSNHNWSNNNITVTINYPKHKESKWKYEYKKDDSEWVPIDENTKEIVFEENDTVIARIIDEGNELNLTTASLFEIINIDKEGPTYKVTGNNTTWEANKTIIIAEAKDSQSGLHDTPYSWDNGVTWTDTNVMTYTSNQVVNILVRDKLENTTKQQVNITHIYKTATFNISGTSSKTKDTITGSKKINDFKNVISIKSNAGTLTHSVTGTTIKASVSGNYNNGSTSKPNYTNTCYTSSPQLTTYTATKSAPICPSNGKWNTQYSLCILNTTYKLTTTTTVKYTCSGKNATPVLDWDSATCTGNCSKPCPYGGNITGTAADDKCATISCTSAGTFSCKRYFESIGGCYNSQSATYTYSCPQGGSLTNKTCYKCSTGYTGSGSGSTLKCCKDEITSYTYTYKYIYTITLIYEPTS